MTAFFLIWSCWLKKTIDAPFAALSAGDTGGDGSAPVHMTITPMNALLEAFGALGAPA